MASAIRRALSIGDFTEADLFTTDDIAMGKLRKSNDAKVMAYLKLLRPGTRFYERTEFRTLLYNAYEAP